MGKLDDLKAELLAGHPVTLAYSPDNAAAADELSAVNRTKDRAEMSASEVLNAVVVTEYAALSAENKTTFWGLLGMGTLSPFGREADVLTAIFGGASGTISSLATARRRSVSRAEELGLGNVRAGTVEQARAL